MLRAELCVVLSVLVSLCLGLGVKQGKVAEFDLDLKFDLSSLSTFALKVSSEIQCVQKCLQQDGCQLMNFRYVWDGETSYNCELNKKAFNFGNQLKMHPAHGWKAAKIERIDEVYDLLGSRSSSMDDRSQEITTTATGVNTESMKATPAISTNRLTTTLAKTGAPESLATSKSLLTLASQFAIATSAHTSYCTAKMYFPATSSILGATLKASAIPETPIVPTESIVTKSSAIRVFVDENYKVVYPDAITSTDTVMTALTSSKCGRSSSSAEISEIVSGYLPLVTTTTATTTTPLYAETTGIASDPVTVHPEVTSSPVAAIIDDITPSTSTEVVASSTVPAGVYPSCNLLRENHPNAKNGVYDLTIGKHHCIMLGEDSSCGSGGWTLAMKIDGRKNTFNSTSNYWTQTILHQEDFVANASMEGKYQAFNIMNFTRICIGFKYHGSIHWMKIFASGISLRKIFADEYFIPSYYSISSWVNLMQGASLQPTCDKQGVNINRLSHMYARIGILCDNSLDFASPNSFIGLGTTWNMPYYCGDAPRVSCGNVASCYQTSNGQKAEAAFCYILIK